MSPKMNDVVWWFHCQSSSGNVYPSWLNLCTGRIVWISPTEYIVHIYSEGMVDISVVFYGTNEIFESKISAIRALSARLVELEDNE